MDLEKLDMTSYKIPEEKREEILRLFPEVRTEGGKIDFERLKLVLGETIDNGKERYGMNWPGKADCFKTIQAPSMGTLLPCPEESVNFDTSENMIIEGDNLEVLKLLQKSYLGKIKMIYIDPPYNTGNDFIYPDNYAESLQTYLEYTGQVDAKGKKFNTNTEGDGRFHSKWLNMMYPRLYLARNLLRDDGVIFISINDKEMENLRRICNEVYGEENFIGMIVWKGATDNNPTQIAIEHEYVLCFARSKELVASVWKDKEDDAKETLLGEYRRLSSDSSLSSDQIQSFIRIFIKANREVLGSITHYDRVDEQGVYTGSRKVHNPKPGGYVYDILHPKTGKACVPPVNGYRYPEETMRELLRENRILFGEDETQIVQIKEYLEDFQGKLSSLVQIDSRAGSNELNNLFGVQKIFLNPKPSQLLRRLFDFVIGEDGTVLDFFGGSGSTGHALLDLNRQTGSIRKFILVQLPENLDPNDKDQKVPHQFCMENGLSANIAEICKERVRRVIAKLNDADNGKLPLEDKPNQDRGFKVFKLAESNFKTWNADVPTGDLPVLKKQLELHIDHIREARSADDILYEILLKSGFPLTTPIEKLSLEGKTVCSAAEGAFLVCLERKLTLDVIRSMAERKPERVVCLDEGFAGNDQLKANAVQIFKTKGITSFKTV